jgi:hypothetical protein
MLKLLKSIPAVIIILVFTAFSALQAQSIGDTVFVYGFESGADSNGLPIGTTGPYDWGDNGSLATVSEDVVHSGNYAGTIYNPDPSQIVNCSMDVMTDDAFEPLATYHASVWVKTAISAGDAQIITAWDNNRIIHVTGNTDWAQYEFDFQAPLSYPNIRLHMQDAKGQAWYDDLSVVLAGLPSGNDSVYNPGFELPNDEGDAPADWFTENWGSGSTEVGMEGTAGSDTLRYIWDNTVAHTGNYSAKIQETPADISHGWMEAAWRTQSLIFKSGGLYELTYWVKINNMPSDYGFGINIGYNNVNKTLLHEDTDWIQVKDTLLFPTDQDDNGWRNQIRFRINGPANADTLVNVWIDDVKFNYLGTQASILDSIVVVRDGANADISWGAHPDVSSPIYHIYMQPYNESGVYDNNILSNPGFEIPSSDGASPQDWFFVEDHWAALPVGEYPADETYDGNFSAWMGELDPEDDRGVYGRWEQDYNVSKLKRGNAYIYGAMVKYENVVALQDSIIDENAPNGYYWSAGVQIFYDRYGFQFQNEDLVTLGWSTPVGTSDGWVQIFLPLIYDQAAGRHHIGLGIGQYWEGLAHGSLYIDNAFVTPFDEIGTTTETNFTVENIPEGVKYFAVAVEDGSGEYLTSTPRIGLLKNATAVENSGNKPLQFELKQNYPNPFNPTTKIEFTIPQSGKVKLAVYDILGRNISTLVNSRDMKAGHHSVMFNASSLASGVYFYQIKTENHIMTKKMMLLK